jgi:hypothetical protein
MNRFSSMIVALTFLASVGLWSAPTLAQDQVKAQDQAGLIPSDKIASLDAKRTEASKAASSARKKLAIRRVIREGEALIKTNPAAPNRYKVLSILFRSQQVLVSLDKSTTNRKAFLATCVKLAAAPNEYAALRLDADLLLTQAKSARQGADSHARSDALRPLVKRYRDTDVEPKVIRIAMIMALEFGNTRLVNDLRKVVAERFPGNMDLINFQREKLAGQVFGAPFIGTFERGDGKTVRFPMDYLGTTTVLYCWSKKKDGVEDLKALAADWKKVQVEFEKKPAGRFQFVSMNMDGLPDAGESILRGLGLDWQALKMPKGQDNPIYQTYVKRDTPTIVIVSPTGYVALYLSGGRSNRTWERRLQSMLSSMWAQPRYCSQLQSLYSGEYLVMNPQADFDPAAPPEYKALASWTSGDAAKQVKLPRTAASVPEEKLRAIQACFIDAPLRYRTPYDQLIANYEKADALCRAAIEAHPKAPDLWIVRNRRITALMGLWKTRGDQEAFAAAVVEANAAVKGDYPKGTDVVARLCLAREAFRAADADPKAIIKDFMNAAGDKQASGPALTAASLLALDTADRLQHDQFRKTFLDKHADDPAMWTATAFLLDRYHRYWMYHPPFTAGWTYGRRQGYFLAVGTPEDAKRTFTTELKTLDGETVKIPESSDGKWTVISFVPTAAGNGYLQRYTSFLAERSVDDVNLIAAVLDDDADAARKLIEELEEKKKQKKQTKPDTFTTLLVPGGMQNPIVRKLGMLSEDTKPNILILRPDGTIANALSGLTMSYKKGTVIQSALQYHDEKNVDAALARGDLKEAKRLAFTHAPVEQLPPPDAPRNWKPRKLSIPHVRSRAKVYLAMGDLKSAFADAEQAYLAVNIKAGYISMRTDELEETQALKATILAGLKQAESKK